jgi:hypothetical protein
LSPPRGKEQQVPLIQPCHRFGPHLGQALLLLLLLSPMVLVLTATERSVA